VLLLSVEEVIVSSIYKTNFISRYEPDANARVELKNGRLLDVVGGAYFDPSVRIVVRRGRIESMPGLPGQPTDPQPDYAIDLQGKTVMPGLFNTHCHINMNTTSMAPDIRDIRLGKRYAEQQKRKNMAECLAHGITNIRDAASEDLRQTWALRERISSGEMPGPRIIQSVVVGPSGSYMANVSLALRVFIRVSGSHFIDHSAKESGLVEFPIAATGQQVRDAIDKAIDERGAEAIKIAEQRESIPSFKPNLVIMSIEQLEALADRARRRGLKTLMHHISVESFRRGVKAGVSSISHVAGDDDLTVEDVEAFKAANCVTEPTASVRYAVAWRFKGDPWFDDPEVSVLTRFRDHTYTYAQVADEYYVPELQERVVAAYKKYSSGRPRALGLFDMSGMPKHAARGSRHGFANFRLLFSEGAKIAIANDGGVPPLTPAMMNLELVFFDLILSGGGKAAGLSGIRAVRMATVNSALSMGLEADFGSIDTGKVADLAVLDGDPLQDFRVIGSRVAALFMDGRLVIDNCGLEVKAVSAA
jgi:imidazolonepropionase-like amidohydrolase